MKAAYGQTRKYRRQGTGGKAAVKNARAAYLKHFRNGKRATG